MGGRSAAAIAGPATWRDIDPQPRKYLRRGVLLVVALRFVNPTRLVARVTEDVE
jgi:hypothetical protein